MKNAVRLDPLTRAYIRPHWDDLLQTMSDSPHISVAVWTSAHLKNAEQMCGALFEEVTPLQFLLDRSHCENAPMGIKVDTVVKNLELIFDSEDLSDNGRWNSTNTILVDDSISKARKTPRNLLHILKFDVENTKVDSNQDTELKRLSEWLRLLKDQPDDADVRKIIETNPLKK